MKYYLILFYSAAVVSSIAYLIMILLHGNRNVIHNLDLLSMDTVEYDDCRRISRCTPPLIANGTILKFGYMSGCEVFVDTNGSFNRGNNQSFDVSDTNGMYSLPYKTPSFIVVEPSSTCKDSVDSASLPAKMISTTFASITSPLTTIASFLMINFNMSADSSSDKISQSFSLQNQVVWHFNSYYSFIENLDRESCMWMMRHEQILTTVYYINTLFMEEMDLPTFDTLSRMVHDDNVIDLTNSSDIEQVINLTATLDTRKKPKKYDDDEIIKRIIERISEENLNFENICLYF